MSGFRREGRIKDSAKKSKRKSIIPILKEYFSSRNSYFFSLMVISVIPAAACHAFYISLNILHIDNTKELSLFMMGNMNLAKYGFVIQPLYVLVTLNLGLIILKIIGNQISAKEKLLDSRVVVIVSIILILIVSSSYCIMYGFKSGSTIAILLSSILVFLRLIEMKFRKLFIFPTILALNLLFLILFFQTYSVRVDFNGNENYLLALLAETGFCWLYVIPYNFFIFFPFIMGICFSNLKYLEKYFSSFLSVIFHENMIPVSMGLLLNILLAFFPFIIIISRFDVSQFGTPPIAALGKIIIELNEFLPRIGGEDQLLTFNIFFVVVNLWITSLSLWFTPLIVNLTQSETKFEANFDRRLRDIIQRMRNHIVIIGYGNLGKKVCSDLIERSVVSLRKDTDEILTPDLEIQKICNRLLVIDINNKLFDRVHMDPILQNIGVARSKIRIAGEKKDILIPAVVGDISSETTKESSQLMKSKFFISVPSDYEATFALSKFANSEDMNSIISVEDSAQKDYFSPKMTAHDTFFIYPAFQEGMALGRITSLSYFRLRDNSIEKGKSENPEIVIAGEGKQIHYLIETFWMEMQRTNIAASWMKPQRAESNLSREKRIFKLPITILTDSEELKTRSRLKKDEIDEKKREIEEITKRSARIEVTDADDHLLVDLIFDTPHRLKSIEEFIRYKEPQIIIVTSKTIQKVSKIFHDWVVAIERHISVKNKNYKPLVIVGVLGDEYEEIKDILLYYTKMNGELGSRFPIQYLDAAVSVYDDSKEQIGGLAQSLAQKGSIIHNNWKIGETKDPFVLYCCLKDVPGSLGNLLGKLAGVEFEIFDPSNTGDQISLHFCRFQNCSGVEDNSFLANAELHERNDIDEEEKLFCCLFQSESENPKRKRLSRDFMKTLLDIEDIKEIFGENIDSTVFCDIFSCCDRRINCSVASYLRKVENLINNRGYYEYLEYIGKFKKGTVDQEIRRFFLNKKFQSSTLNEKQNHDLPKAAIMVCCRHSKVTGSLATAVNNLLFKNIKEIYEENIADITYLRSYECYNPSFTYVEIYGNLVDADKRKRKILLNERVINSVFINVATKKYAWFNYAKRLCQALNKIYGENLYEFWVDDYMENIAVICRDFMKRGYSDKMSPHCMKHNCTIHNKMILLKKVPIL